MSGCSARYRARLLVPAFGAPTITKSGRRPTSDSIPSRAIRCAEARRGSGKYGTRVALRARQTQFKLGMAVGISSGANFIAALIAQNQLGPGAVVATLFPDSNKKYLGTDLMAEEPEREGCLSPEVELLGVRAIGRVCTLSRIRCRECSRGAVRPRVRLVSIRGVAFAGFPQVSDFSTSPPYSRASPSPDG